MALQSQTVANTISAGRALPLPRGEQGAPTPAAQPCVLPGLLHLGGRQPWAILQAGRCYIIFLFMFHFFLLVVYEYFSQMNLEGGQWAGEASGLHSPTALANFHSSLGKKSALLKYMMLHP